MDKYIKKPFVLEALKRCQFKEFTQMQVGVFESLSNSKSNLMIKGKTGSGKTHGYLVPIFNSIDASIKETQAVIIAPTALLVKQIGVFAKAIAEFAPEEIVIKEYTASTDRLREISKLKNNQPHIAIATPGKLVDLAIKENILKIHKATYFVIDEADMIADSFLEDLLPLANKCVLSRKIILSATFRQSLLVLFKSVIPNTEFIDYDLSSNNQLAIKHYLIPAKNKDKSILLEQLIKIINPYMAIIFANKIPTVTEIYSFLKQKGYSVAQMHGDLSMSARKMLQKDIAKMKYQYIVGSDVMARGIDIEGVSCVINFDLPRDYEFYIHRTGRTGRMHFTGDAYSLWEYADQEYYESLKQKGIDFSYLEIKNNELVPYTPREERKKQVNPDIVAAVRRIPKPKQVKPGYKKKYQEKVKKAVKTTNRRNTK